MPIGQGQMLLQYRVGEKIGEGGMGVVWRALDTSLRREVAIKVLSEPLSHHGETLARFDREAKLLASLNHSNIAAIYTPSRPRLPSSGWRPTAPEPRL